MQLTSQLSLTEMLAVMQGNFGAIQGVHRKLKTVLMKRMGGQDDPIKRKKLVEEESAKFKALLFVPREVEPNIYEGFDPILVSEDVVDSHFAKGLNLILDFDESAPDAEFVELIKDSLIFFIGEWIDELQDGFKNGMSDVVVFLRENFKKLIQVGTGPEMGMMIGALGTDTIMNYVTKAYAKYQVKKKELKQPKTQPKPAEDVKMEEVEESKDESPEAKKKRFLERWSSIINEDVAGMTRDPPVQRPLSRAYLSVCPASRAQNKQVQEEKN